MSSSGKKLAGKEERLRTILSHEDLLQLGHEVSEVNNYLIHSDIKKIKLTTKSVC